MAKRKAAVEEPVVVKRGRKLGSKNKPKVMEEPVMVAVKRSPKSSVKNKVKESAGVTHTIKRVQKGKKVLATHEIVEVKAKRGRKAGTKDVAPRVRRTNKRIKQMSKVFKHGALLTNKISRMGNTNRVVGQKVAGRPIAKSKLTWTGHLKPEFRGGAAARIVKPTKVAVLTTGPKRRGRKPGSKDLKPRKRRGSVAMHVATVVNRTPVKKVAIIKRVNSRGMGKMRTA